jgi:oligopeptide/dipeptide ABC transporter ATP-binding protein
MEKALVKIHNLQRHYPISSGFLDRFKKNPKTVKALNGVNLTIYRGETLGLVGESGCGKSTLGRIALGIESPTKGFVVYKGKRIEDYRSNEQKKQLRKEIQMIFQNPSSSLDPRMTVKQILSEPFEIHTKLTKKELKEKIGKLLRMVGLNPADASKYSGSFSDGQKQRIAILRALALDPEFIVADEPVSALDVSVQAQILNLIKELQRQMGLTMLFISHDLQVVRFLSDRIAVIYLGKIMELGPGEEFFGNPYHPYSEGLLSSVMDLEPDKCFGDLKIVADVPVSQVNIPRGCVFHLKCPEATEKCKQIEPELREISEGHFVACVNR